MYPSFLSAIAAASLACGVAQASTVNVDFAGGAFTTVATSGTSSYRTYTEATWYENGVNTRFKSHVDVLNDYGYSRSELEPYFFTGLSDLDPGHDPNSTDTMVVSRADGGRFNLLRVGSENAFEGRGIVGSFLPENGDRQYVEYNGGFLPLFGPSLKVSGLKGDGSIVEMLGTAKSFENWGGYPNEFGSTEARGWYGPMDVFFKSTDLSAFTDLVELTMQVDWKRPATIESISDAGILRDLGYSPEFIEGIRQCGPISVNCVVPGLGKFDFVLSEEADELVHRNDLVRVGIADIDLEFVGEGGPAPIATPLPAPAALLLCGLGTLIAIRRRRPAR